MITVRINNSWSCKSIRDETNHVDVSVYIIWLGSIIIKERSLTLQRRQNSKGEVICITFLLYLHWISFLFWTKRSTCEYQDPTLHNTQMGNEQPIRAVFAQILLYILIHPSLSSHQHVPTTRSIFFFSFFPRIMFQTFADVRLFLKHLT